jgi:hypothetical protein
MFPVLCLVITVGSALYWISSYRSRLHTDLGSLLEKMDPTLRTVMIDQSFTDSERQRAADDKLYGSLHGLAGHLKICRNAGILVNFAALSAVEFPEESPRTKERLFQRAGMIRLFLLPCVAEAIIVKCFKTLPIPRLATRFSVEQYAEMCSEVRAIIEYRHEKLISRFDELI